MIIGFVNQKGGVGKSTIALNVAAAYAAEGRRVLLVDADPQATVTEWAERREATPFDMLQMHKAVIHKQLPKIAEGYDVAVIDGPPRSYDVTRSAIACSNRVIIPVQPSGADLWASREVVELVKEAANFNDDLKAAFVISRGVSGTAIARDMREAVPEEYGLPLLGVGTCQRIAFAEAMTAGQTVLEYEPSGKAAEEIKALVAAIEEM